MKHGVVGRKRAKRAADVSGSKWNHLVFPTVVPVARRLLEVHHCEYPNVVGFNDVNDGMGKRAPEVAPGGGGTEDAKMRRVSLNLSDEFVNMAIESLP